MDIDSSSNAIDQSTTTAPLPVLQLRTWSVIDEPIHVVVAMVLVMFFTFFVYTAASAGMAAIAFLAQTISLWRLLLPTNYELDARGVQQVVLGRRSFWRWKEFSRYEIRPRGVVLRRHGAEFVLAQLADLRIPAIHRHLQLVSLVSSYLDQRALPLDVYSMSTLATDEFQAMEKRDDLASLPKHSDSSRPASVHSLLRTQSLEGDP